LQENPALKRVAGEGAAGNESETDVDNTPTDAPPDAEAADATKNLGVPEEEKGSFYSFLKKVATGIDLSRVTAPAFLLAPRSQLEWNVDMMSHPKTFTSCVSEAFAGERERLGSGVGGVEGDDVGRVRSGRGAGPRSATLLRSQGTFRPVRLRVWSAFGARMLAERRETGLEREVGVTSSSRRSLTCSILPPTP
jgi:hypothetical protein